MKEKTAKKSPPETIDAYIAGFPHEIQQHLEQIRKQIKKTAPVAEEYISYGMPAFRLEGKYLIYFAAHKKHVGLYPVPDAPEFQEDYASYKTTGKGTIQFPNDRPMPLGLISRIINYRISKTRKK